VQSNHKVISLDFFPFQSEKCGSFDNAAVGRMTLSRVSLAFFFVFGLFRGRSFVFGLFRERSRIFIIGR